MIDDSETTGSHSDKKVIDRLNMLQKLQWLKPII